MKVKFCLCLFICVLVAVINGKHVKSKPDFEDDYGEMADENLPSDNVNYFGPTVENVQNNDNIPVEVRTKPQVFVANIGDTVRLPCEVTSDYDFVLIWRKNHTLLYQGETSLHRNSNIRRESNGALQVNLTSEKDFGEYSCEIMTNEHLKIIHTVVRLAAPTILTISTALNKATYKVDETLTLTCNAIGYPKPKISWFKDNKRLEREGEVLIIEGLTFRDAGNYRCLADNKIEPPAHNNITIHVEHKPVVLIEKYIVNSDKEFDAELKCTVHAFPKANIVWKKNGTNVKSIPGKIKLQPKSNIENVLIITNLTDEDFDKYTCSAKNSLGKVDKTINLVRTPAVQGLNKPEKINKDFVLTWRVESKSPIAEHELQYRKSGEEEWKIIKPEVTKTDQDTYIVKHTLKGLDSGNYEIRVRSRNIHGWSEYSDIITFDGILAKNGSHHKPHNKKHHKEKNLKEKQVPTSAPETPAQPPEPERSESSVKVPSSGYSLVPSTVGIISIALLSLFFHKQ